MKTLAILLTLWFVWVCIDRRPSSQTYDALQRLRADLLNGKRQGTKAGRHVLQDYASLFKQHPELFTISEPYPLNVMETGETIWALDLTAYERARDRFDDLKHGDVVLSTFHNTDSNTLKIYTY